MFGRLFVRRLRCTELMREWVAHTTVRSDICRYSWHKPRTDHLQTSECMVEPRYLIRSRFAYILVEMQSRVYAWNGIPSVRFDKPFTIPDYPR